MTKRHNKPLLSQYHDYFDLSKNLTSEQRRQATIDLAYFLMNYTTMFDYSDAELRDAMPVAETVLDTHAREMHSVRDQKSAKDKINA